MHGIKFKKNLWQLATYIHSAMQTRDWKLSLDTNDISCKPSFMRLTGGTTSSLCYVYLGHITLDFSPFKRYKPDLSSHVHSSPTA